MLIKYVRRGSHADKLLYYTFHLKYSVVRAHEKSHLKKKKKLHIFFFHDVVLSVLSWYMKCSFSPMHRFSSKLKRTWNNFKRETKCKSDFFQPILLYMYILYIRYYTLGYVIVKAVLAKQAPSMNTNYMYTSLVGK